MAPEYALRGNYSVKSDAFSFGVTVLEIITGRKNSAIYNGGKPDDLLDTVSVISLLCLVSIVVVTHCGEVWLDHGDNQPTPCRYGSTGRLGRWRRRWTRAWTAASLKATC